jgi:hypothetical protein
MRCELFPTRATATANAHRGLVISSWRRFAPPAATDIFGEPTARRPGSVGSTLERRAAEHDAAGWFHPDPVLVVVEIGHGTRRQHLKPRALLRHLSPKLPALAPTTTNAGRPEAR